VKINVRLGNVVTVVRLRMPLAPRSCAPTIGVAEDERDARRATVAGVDGEPIRRKPVLGDLVNEYTPAAQRAEDPQVTGRILMSCGTRLSRLTWAARPSHGLPGYSCLDDHKAIRCSPGWPEPRNRGAARRGGDGRTALIL
jgi:hypothetical protein